LSKIKICSLGGIGENGKNLYIVDVDDRMFILDAGLIYPDIDSYGIDAVVPNIDYLKENENRIVGIFLSHGHEDHIGAIAYILDNIKCPIYASTFTILLLEEFLKANDRKIKDYELHRVGRGKTLKFGDVSVSFIRVNHSLPETTIIVLGTKDGKIIYAPDFNFSVAINKNYEVDYDKLLELSKSKVLVTMAESIGISGNNRTFNDDLFTSSLFNSIDRVKGNTYVICYSTDIGRIQQITDMAYAMNKKVGIIGLKNEAVTDMAIKNHYLDIKPEMFAGRNIESSSSQVVFIVGIYTEPYYLISKMLKGQVKGVTLGKDDLIITLSNMSAGNTNYALSVIDEILEDVKSGKLQVIDIVKLYAYFLYFIDKKLIKYDLNTVKTVFFNGMNLSALTSHYCDNVEEELSKISVNDETGEMEEILRLFNNINLQLKDKMYTKLADDVFKCIPMKMEIFYEKFDKECMNIPIFKYYDVFQMFQRISCASNEDIVTIKELLDNRANLYTKEIAPEMKQIARLKGIIEDYIYGKETSIKNVMLKEFANELGIILSKYEKA